LFARLPPEDLVTGIPLLVTMDLEIAADHDGGEQRRALTLLGDIFHGRGVRATIFTTLTAAETFASEVRMLAAQGHEIGCHGVDHADGEDYRRMPFGEACGRIAIATEGIERAVGIRPRTFRGPRMTTSASTQRALIDLGYRGDLSVCSRRLDFFNSRGATLAALGAPLEPYRPADTSATRKGRVPIAVIPLSGLGVPFLSGVLFTAGLGASRAIFRLLRAEAERHTRAIVFSFHSYELAGRLRPGGGKWLHRLYLQDREERRRRLEALLDSMVSDPEVLSLTASELIERTGLLPEGSSAHVQSRHA
jgi:peptidoglycan/xylan/chitin deacetylase (PgdA/CDA1 family)